MQIGELGTCRTSFNITIYFNLKGHKICDALCTPQVSDLNALLAARPRDFPDAGKTLRMAVSALNKVTSHT